MKFTRFHIQDRITSPNIPQLHSTIPATSNQDLGFTSSIAPKRGYACIVGLAGNHRYQIEITSVEDAQ